MLRSGSTSGVLHGRGTSITGATGTKLDIAGFNHDGYRFRDMATNSSIQFGWIRDAWAGPGTELGPWGQAYRLYGTLGFGTIGVLQFVAGF
jgi:hypothetical protein